MDNILAIDLETACAVEGCKHFGRSLCSEDHSLSPWHSRITVIGVYGKLNGIETKATFREVSAFTSFISGLDPVVTFIGHNFKFDLLHLYAKGVHIDLAKWSGDSQLAAYVLTEKITDEWLEAYNKKRKEFKGQREAGKHSLKTLAPYFLGVEPFWESSDHDNDEYVLRDCEYTYRLYDCLCTKLQTLEQYNFLLSKQLPWTKLLLRAEMRGLKIDLDALPNMEADYKQALETLSHKLDTQWHEAHVAYTELAIAETRKKYKTQKGADAAIARLTAGVSYSSPKQMLWMLRDHYGYDCTSLEGEEGTGREILERLAAEGHKDVETYLEYRKVQKILTAFLPTYQGLQVGGTIRPIYSPDVTRTGRTSSQRPNLQQVPPSLRGLFVARQGYTFIGYDASAIEAKLIALYSSDPALYDIVSSGASIHDYNTRLFFGRSDVPLESVKTLLANERKATKNVGFALFYSAGKNRIRITFAQKGYHLSDYECGEILQTFRETYAKAFEFNKAVISEMESGNVITNLLGRPVKIQNPDDAYMTAFNSLIQSSASDLNLEAARRAQEEYDKLGMDAHVVGFIHDYVKVEAHDSIKDQAEQILVKHMTGFQLDCDLGPIKLTVEGGQMSHWEK